MRIETIPQYIAEDGKKFDTEAECVAYEAAERKRLANITYWSVYYNFDCTEGRGFVSGALYEVPTNDLAHEYMLDYCVAKFGRAVCYVQGVSAAPAWRLTQIDKEKFDAGMSVGIGDYRRDAPQIKLKFELEAGRDRGAYKLVEDK
jgi:hypothetical protein